MIAESITAKLGYAADPAIEILLPKDLLAQIKIRRLDASIREFESAISDLKLQQEMLMKQYPAKK